MSEKAQTLKSWKHKQEKRRFQKEINANKKSASCKKRNKYKQEKIYNLKGGKHKREKYKFKSDKI